MSTIFCDNDGCMFSDGCGFCDCDKLSIVGGVCEGSYVMNTSDDNERLKAENAKLRELVRDMWRDGMCECDERWNCEACEYGYLDRIREFGIEVKDD